MLDSSLSSYLKRAKRQDNDCDLRRYDSFFSDTQKFDIVRRQDSLFEGTQNLQRMAEQELKPRVNFNDVVSLDDAEEPPQMVLQRNPQISLAYSNTTIFGLTVVCAVLGVITAFHSAPQQYNYDSQNLYTGAQMASHTGALKQC